MSDQDSQGSLVDRLGPNLTSKQRRHLRSLAHSLNPIVQVGQKGVTQGLIDSLVVALLTHELVKVKVHDADSIEEVAEALAAGTGAALAQKIGKTLLFFQAHPEEPVIKLPREKKSRP